MENEVMGYSPIRLAYLGDAVYELRIREWILAHYDYPMNRVHKLAVTFVRAAAQAKVAHELIPLLLDEEIKILKKGRNTKGMSTPKHASISEYRYATGFETLLGYLYVQEKHDRIQELIAFSVEVLHESTE